MYRLQLPNLGIGEYTNFRARNIPRLIQSVKQKTQLQWYPDLLVEIFDDAAMNQQRGREVRHEVSLIDLDLTLLHHQLYLEVGDKLVLVGVESLRVQQVREHRQRRSNTTTIATTTTTPTDTTACCKHCEISYYSLNI